MKLERPSQNPILSPEAAHPWEDACVGGPGIWCDNGRVHMLYGAGGIQDGHILRFGLAESNDGLHFDRVDQESIFGPSNDGFDGGCVENPRVVRFGDIYYITYATRMFAPEPGGNIIPLRQPDEGLLGHTAEAIKRNLTRGALAATRDFRTWFRLGPITQAAIDDRHVILFPQEVRDECVLLHRPTSWTGAQYGCEKPSIWLSVGPDLMSWKKDHLLAQPEQDWEENELGGCAPPLKTQHGWLMLYHGVDSQGVCRIGAMVLDKADPTHILGRTPEPILEPEAEYETTGLQPHTLTLTGTVVKNDTLFAYYGAGGTHIAVATAPVEELVAHVLDHPVA